jgi:NAD(P)-dependent dehydrogenase (short-subunit alcohol dehydrogenase family)
MSRTAVITGAGSGIGLATARRLLEEGWTVIPSGLSPLGRSGQPEDVTRVIRFLLGDDAGYVTGTTIPVDGGTCAAFVPPGDPS